MKCIIIVVFKGRKIEEEQPKCVANREGLVLCCFSGSCFRFMHAVLLLTRNIIHVISTNHRGFKQDKAAPQWRTSGIIHCITFDS